MQAAHAPLTLLSDGELLAEVQRLAAAEGRATAALVASLAELDTRRLYLAQGYSSLFTYCTHVLLLSEDAAYTRIEAARAARRFPAVLERLASGRVSLTTVRRLAPRLTEENHVRLLDAAGGRSTRDVEEMLALWNPQPDVPATLRRLPDRAAAPRRALSPRLVQVPLTVRGQREPVAVAWERPAQPSPPRCQTVVAPLSPGRYKLQVTISAGTRDKLRQVQAMLRHRLPSGDLAEIVDRALTALLTELERTKAATTSRVTKDGRTGTAARGRRRSSARVPRGHQSQVQNADVHREVVPEQGEEHPGVVPKQVPSVAQGAADQVTREPSAARRTRYIPAAVRRAVWTRDQGRCAFVGATGRCDATAFLEFHHVVPFGAGGNATVENVSLRCRNHNRHEAETFFTCDWSP